jgi:hypothetical protein
MLRRILPTPRLPEPLPAVMAGAGFFVFLAAMTGLGPFGALDQALWRASQPGEAQAVAQSAVRVLGRTAGLSGAAKVDALAEDLRWLRREGAGAIVLEAWLDEAPQAEARQFSEALFERLQFLAEPGRSAALEALSETSALIDAAPRLADALSAAQPVLLAWQAVPGSGPPLPEALRRQGYEVTLRGQRQRLPELRALNLPWDGALNSVARSGACTVPDGSGRLPAVVEIRGRWFNALGLEAARLAMGLPLEGLRYRWRKGTLSSLELQGTRYPLDTQGRVLLPERLPDLASFEIGHLQGDAVARERLRGKVVFYRPWPRQLGEAKAFEEQSRLFTALMERNLLTPPPAVQRQALWVLAWVLTLTALGLLPLWAGLLIWAALPYYAMHAFWQDPQSVAQPLALGLSALLLGTGWRLQRRHRRLTAAAAQLKGWVALPHQERWEARLRTGEAGLDAAFAVLGPRGRLQGPIWEAWLARWGGFLDLDQGVDALGILLPAPQAEALALKALAELREQFEGLQASLAFGSLALEQRESLGAPRWRVSGPAKDLALQLFASARPGQCLILEKDYPAIRNLVQIQVTGQALEGDGATEGRQILNLLAVSGKL